VRSSLEERVRGRVALQKATLVLPPSFPSPIRSNNDEKYTIKFKTPESAGSQTKY